MYAKFLKRVFDFILSFCALIVLSPFMLVTSIIGLFMLNGNPYFCQERIGRNERVFKLIKFRTMTNETDSEGKLLPDEKRLTRYGHFLRSTSLDELPELINVVKGEMAIIGPRPLLVRYLPYYTDEEHHRHDVRPGITGLAQVNGRNFQSWDERFSYDLKYVRNISLKRDLAILIKTVKIVLRQEGIGDMEEGEIIEDKEGNLWSSYKGHQYRIYRALDEERRTEEI